MATSVLIPFDDEQWRDIAAILDVGETLPYNTQQLLEAFKVDTRKISKRNYPKIRKDLFEKVMTIQNYESKLKNAGYPQFVPQPAGANKYGASKFDLNTIMDVLKFGELTPAMPYPVTELARVYLLVHPEATRARMELHAWLPLREALCYAIRDDEVFRQALYHEGRPWYPKKSSDAPPPWLQPAQRKQRQNTGQSAQDASMGVKQRQGGNQQGQQGQQGQRNRSWCDAEECNYGKGGITLKGAMKAWEATEGQEYGNPKEELKKLAKKFGRINGIKSTNDAMKAFLCSEAQSDPGSEFCKAITQTIGTSSHLTLKRDDYKKLFSLSNRGFQKEIASRFGRYAPTAPSSTPVNKCVSTKLKLNDFLPHQEFFRHYFTPQNPAKGCLLLHSVGSGKTCLTIADLSYSFEGWRILWVTRSRLRNVPRETMFIDKCDRSVRAGFRGISAGTFEERDSALRKGALGSKAWKRFGAKRWSGGHGKGKGNYEDHILTYREFANLCNPEKPVGRVSRLGMDSDWKDDRFQKTVIVIDEAHNIYADEKDLTSHEMLTRDGRDGRHDIEQSLWHSYNTSGHKSCKVILLTATPIVEMGKGADGSPQSSIMKLVNLTLAPKKQGGLGQGGFGQGSSSDGSDVLPSYEGALPTTVSGVSRILLTEKKLTKFAKAMQGVVSVYEPSNQPDYFPMKMYTQPIEVKVPPAVADELAKKVFRMQTFKERTKRKTSPKRSVQKLKPAKSSPSKSKPANIGKKKSSRLHRK